MSGIGLLVPGRANCPLAPAATATRPKVKFQPPLPIDTRISHGAQTLSMRGPVAVVASLTILASFGASFGCGLSGDTIPKEDWTCEWDADESRPLADPSSPVNEAGVLPSSECQATCGPPVTSCTRTVLDGGQLGAVCPVCTF
jgi:hypothetical protein